MIGGLGVEVEMSDASETGDNVRTTQPESSARSRPFGRQSSSASGEVVSQGVVKASSTGDRVRANLVAMTGRDPAQSERPSSPLELLLDLTFVVAVGIASEHFAELLAEGHIASAVVAFMLAMSAISVAWIGFSWFASAFDTDDWLYRIITMVQMSGVVVFALGLPTMFHSIDEGHGLDMRVMVLGYVVMRFALICQWWRAARTAAFRAVAIANIRWTGIIQILWLVVAFTGFALSDGVIFVLFGAVAAADLLIPVLTGSVKRTPWHPHHIAERYGLFTIIVLGESLVGTLASSSGMLGGGSGAHWSPDVVAIIVAGVGLTFGMWWVYFIAPFGDALVRYRGRAYVFGYGHIPLFIAVAAVGGGLHVAGLQLEHHSALGAVAVVLCLAVPVAAYLLSVYTLYSVLLASSDSLHVWLLVATMGVLVLAVALAALGVEISVCLLVIMIAPFVTVVGYEAVGRHHQERLLL